MMNRLVDAYFRLLKVLIALMLAAMMALVLGNVVLRYAFDSGITVSEELSRWLFVWLVFLGAILGMREHAHLGMESLVLRLPPRWRRACQLLSHALMLYATVLVVQGSWQQMFINMGMVAPASGLSLALVYAAGVTFGVSTFAILAVELWRMLRGQDPVARPVSAETLARPVE